MTVAVFDLNDCAIGHGSNTENWQESPGFALLESDAIVTGHKARERAWLEPQRSFQHYWHQLNLSPLSSHNRFARHHADLAYAQLQQLHQDSQQPEEVILAVPGNFTREQLALLLGLIKASRFQAVGLVDSAIAAVSNAPVQQNGLHLDIQLHQCVITRISVDGEIHRASVEPLNDLGLKGMMDSWAHHIAEQFIRQYRYDPLHTAQGEQQLYDQLPKWLSDLQSSQQATASLDTAKGNFNLNLLRDDLMVSSQSRLQRLLQGVEKFLQPGDCIYLSHRLAQLPGVVDALNTRCHVLTEHAVLEGCLQHQQAIRSDSEALKFITRLPADNPVSKPQSTAATTTAADRASPTHALIGHRALAIQSQLGLSLNENGQLTASPESDADLVLAINGSGLKLHSRPGVQVEAPSELYAGSVIKLAGKPIVLIQVET